MPKFSKKSLERLSQCHEDLQDVFMKVIEKFDCTVVCGHRNKEDQDEAFRTGKSELEWPNSQHNSDPSRAIDVVPYPVDWNDKERFYHFAGYVLGVAEGMGVKLRWGGDWDSDHDLKDQKFFDLPHFELAGDDVTKDLPRIP